MATHKEARPLGFDTLDHFPARSIDDGDHTFLDIRGCQYGFTLVVPGDAGTQVRHTGECHFADSTFQVEIDHLAGAVAGGADDLVVLLGHEEVVEIILELDTAYGKGLLLVCVTGLSIVVVNPAGEAGRCSSR